MTNGPAWPVWRMGNSIFVALLTAGLFKLLAEGTFAGWFSGPDALRNGYAVAGALWGLIIVVSPLLVVALRARAGAGTA